MFDTHAHLTDEAFTEDRAELLSRFASAEIDFALTPGCDLASSVEAVQLAEANARIFAAVGTHPDAANEIAPSETQINETVIEDYKKLCLNHPKVRAIGEIGLDYHYETHPRLIQQAAFRAQLALADALGLPVIVHEREAHEDGLRIIAEFPRVTGVFHCFSGPVDMAIQLAERGWFIGFTGTITFKNGTLNREVAKALPLSQIVLETDCPYMAPTPFRGKRSDPTQLYRMAETLAQVRELPLEDIKRITVENAKRLYRL